MVVLPPSLQRPVATVPTVYGIETRCMQSTLLRLLQLQQYLPFTVLKLANNPKDVPMAGPQLQQYLPFTVLKPTNNDINHSVSCTSLLQQYLPFTVLNRILRQKPRVD